MEKSSKMEKYQAKSITPVDDYKFTLSDDLRKMAEEELRETDEIRRNAIEALREWAIKNPRIVSLRLDAKFLLRFLRFKKMSIPMAREAIERYLVLRKYFFEGELIYQNFDYKLPALFALINEGLIFPLPERDHLRRLVIFHRPRVFSPSKNIKHDTVRSYGVVFETLLEDEENQIRGVVHVIDGSGLGLHYITIMTPQEGYRIGKNAERMVPMRHKGFIGTPPHPSLMYPLNWAISIMSEKLRKRIEIHASLGDITTVDTKLFPKEYGGSIPMNDMIAMFKKQLEDKRDIVLMHDNMHVNMQMYPEAVRLGSVRSLKVPLDSPNEDFDEKKDLYGMAGVQGSFRKLEID